jgi:hypothetical protein
MDVVHVVQIVTVLLPMVKRLHKVATQDPSLHSANAAAATLQPCFRTAADKEDDV